MTPRIPSAKSAFTVLPAELCTHTDKIPLSIKLAFTAFMAVLVPVYWTHYGPLNFLYFCDLALLLTLVGLWRESPLLISMPAVGILAPQVLWLVDYAANFAGVPLTGMTDYMFDETKPVLLRGLSLFHGWLPLLLIYAVYKLGYDKRGFAAWTALAWAVMAVSFFFLPAPSPETADAVANVNYVFGFSTTEPQSWMPAWAWFAGMLVALPALLMAPVHLLLSRFVPVRAAAARG
jgi:hypothetical protein